MHLQVDTLKDRLQSLGLFSPDDLSFNQNGDMSPQQMHTVGRFVRFWYICLGIYLVLIVVISVLAIWVGLLEQHIDRYIGLIVFWILILGVFSAFSYQYAQPYLLDLIGQRVRLVVGVLHKYHTHVSVNRTMGMSYCNVEIKGQQFAIPLDAYNDIVDHQAYRLFYLPNSRKIVNLLPIS